MGLKERQKAGDDVNLYNLINYENYKLLLNQSLLNKYSHNSETSNTTVDCPIPLSIKKKTRSIEESLE